MATELAKPATTMLQDPMFLRELAKVTPKSIGLTPERIARIAVTCIKTNPAIGDCDRDSILGCVMLCAQFGFDPGGPSGLAYLVPYGRVCTFILGYKGLIQLAVRSGTVESIRAVLIREGDEFTVIQGSSPEIRHKPNWKENGEVIGAYAIAKLRGGGEQFEIMNAIDIRAIESRSRAKGGPWKTDWNEMARKTVTRRLCKYLVLTPEIQEAVGNDEAAEHGYDQTLPIIDVPVVEGGNGKTKSEKTADKLKAKAAPAEIVQEGEPESMTEGPWLNLRSLIDASKVGDTFELTVHQVANDSYPKGHRFRVSDGPLTETIWTPATGPLTDAIVAADSLRFTGGTVVEDKGERKFVAEKVEAV